MDENELLVDLRWLQNYLLHDGMSSCSEDVGKAIALIERLRPREMTIAEVVQTLGDNRYYGSSEWRAFHTGSAWTFRSGRPTSVLSFHTAVAVSEKLLREKEVGRG